MLKTNSTATGYDAAKKGEADQPELRAFSEGWNVFHDSAWWEKKAAKIGCKLYGFSFRSSATFIWPNGDLLEVSKGLINYIDGLPDALFTVNNEKWIFFGYD